MRFCVSTIVLASIAALAACTARAPQPTPAPPVARPAPTPTATPTPVATHATWMDAPQTAGDWFYRAGGGTTRALFGDAGADARFAITCDLAQRSVNLSRAGTAPGATQMIVRTEAAERGLAAVVGTATVPSIDARLPATDTILDAMAFSKGRFAVEVAGLDTLYLPSWPEITRVIEDCRR